MRNLIPTFIQERLIHKEFHGEFRAFAMFVDLSGFTSLTETLMQQGNEGAESLSLSLNNIFGPMVRLVCQRGGLIPHFAGDAFVALFKLEQEDDATRQAKNVLSTAIALRNLFTQERLKKTRFGTFPIGIKLGLGFGEIEWGIVGDDLKSFYFNGQPIDSSADCQSNAQDQQIIMDPAFYEFVAAEGLEIEEMKPGYFEYTSLRSKFPFIQTGQPVKRKELEPAIVNYFLPGEIINFNQIGEFRSVIAVFLSFDGIADHNEMDRFATTLLNQVKNFNGYFKEIDFGDKGGIMVSFFGAPVSYENNSFRALEFVLAIKKELDDQIQNTDLRIRAGITSGTAYTGIVGGEDRCQYAAVGNRVNLAARLMINADWGEVLVDEEMQKERHFSFKHKGDIRYKGIEGQIPTYQLVGHQLEPQSEFGGTMLARDEELDSLLNFFEPLFSEGTPRIGVIYGEAGIGKSRLSFELKKELEKENSLNWFTCQSDQILKKSFNPFVYFLKNFFNQSPDNSLSQNHQLFEDRFYELIIELKKVAAPDTEKFYNELLRTKSVLAALCGIYYDNSLWQQLDAKGKYDNTFLAIANFFLATTLFQPLIIELEDGHWYDKESITFLNTFIKRIKDRPIGLLITSRYDDNGNKPRLIEVNWLKQNNIPQLEIDLNILNAEGLQAFAETTLEGPINDDFFAFLQRTTNGNPFYIEQILEYFQESDLLRWDTDSWRIKDEHVKLSSSINAVLTARIDRLSSLVKETVKAAAVIGREFEIPVLSEVMKHQVEFVKTNGDAQRVLKEQIKQAERGQIWRAMNELRYIFKHSLLREAVYDMQLRTRLRSLHQLIAEAIERLYEKRIEDRYVDLAFHYEQAENVIKTIEYLEKAADFARSNYQNQQALIFYDKLLIYVSKKDKKERIKTLIKKGSVLELIGDWEECEKILTLALNLSRETGEKALIARANNKLGYLQLQQGDYEEAKMHLNVAVTYFEIAKDEIGQIKAYGNLGNLFFRQGMYDDAKAYFIKGIELNAELGHPVTVTQTASTLGLIYMNQGLYTEGINWQQAQIELCEKSGNKQGMAILYTNMGIILFEKGDDEEALKSLEKGLVFSEELGNKQMMAIAIGTIGSIYQRKGAFETAMDNFQQDLQICEEIGDKQGVAIALGLIGELYSVTGKLDEAKDFLLRNLNLCQELGYKKGMAKANNTLGDVFNYMGEYEESISYYNKAIEITRSINNKLVLGFSLMEKAIPSLQLNDLEEAAASQNEALEIGLEIKNEELIFASKLIGARIKRIQGNDGVAEEILQELLLDAGSQSEKAEVYYELWRLAPKNKQAFDKALQVFQQLYEQSPTYIYNQRLNELKNWLSFS